MDKSQKQLLDTYFRKRKIAAELAEGEVYKVYELLYGVKNGYADLNDTESYVRADYFNKLAGRHIYDHVSKFGLFGGYIALASRESYNSSEFFINRSGELDTTGADPKLLNPYGSWVRTSFFNQKYGTMYNGMSSFDNDGKSMVYDSNNDKYFYVNVNNEPFLGKAKPSHNRSNKTEDIAYYTTLEMLKNNG